MIDPTLHELIEQTINSPIKLQLVLLFHENPMLELDVKQASNRIYRSLRLNPYATAMLLCLI